MAYLYSNIYFCFIFNFQDKFTMNNLELLESICECSSTTKGDVVMMVMDLAKKYFWSWNEIIDVFTFIDFLHPNVLAMTKYKLFKFLNFKELNYKYHIFCEHCQIFVKVLNREDFNASFEAECYQCDRKYTKNNASYFVTFDIASQIKNLMENEEVRRHLLLTYEKKTTAQEEGVITDVYDGVGYRSTPNCQQVRDSPWAMRCGFNTDGAPGTENSRMTMWPLFFQNLDLPLHLRSKYTMIAGLYIGNKDPPLNLFMEPFVEEANKMSEEGVSWDLNGTPQVAKAFFVCCCVDSAARHQLLNMKKYNGLFGCTFCAHPTEAVKGYRKYPMSTAIYNDRDDASMRQIMDSNEPKEGIKGPCALQKLRFFNLRAGMLPDFMHAILLGVTKHFLEIVVTTTKKPYYIGKPRMVRKMNDRIKSLRHSTSISRCMRVINDRKQWKASEYLLWLIVYSLVVFEGILPAPYLEHWAMLVAGINILLQDRITYEDIARARMYLIKFVVKFQTFFGKQNMRYNIHLILHMCRSVLEWGPLWAINCFTFENKNRLILQLKKNPRHAAIEIANKFLLFKSLDKLRNSMIITQRSKDFFKKITNKNGKFYTSIDNCILLGSGKQYILNEEESVLYPHEYKTCKVYQKMKLNNIRYTTETYTSKLKSNDSVFKSSKTYFGIIQSICLLTNENDDAKVVIFYKKISEQGVPYFQSEDVVINHLVKCASEEFDELSCCRPFEISKPAILMNIDNKRIVCAVNKGLRAD